MPELIRITNHPTDPALALIHTGPTLAPIMGQLPEARRSPEHRAYLLHVDALPGLRALAQHHHLHVIDQTTTPDPRGRPVAQECRHCQQPGSWAHPPRYCPSCGNQWEPVPPPTTDLHQTYPDCPQCGHHQTGRFTYCTRCGTTLDPSVPETPAPTPDRHHLEDPLPLDHLLAAHLDDAHIQDT